MRKIGIAIIAVTLMSGAWSCRQELTIPLPEPEEVAPPSQETSVRGFYLLNEGNMGSNKATLDYWDASSGSYFRNIYSAANPQMPMEMGDVGNDLQIYGSKLYAVINCSNKVEVMDVRTAVRVGQIDIPNCRHIAFADGYAYVTSYAGPVEVNPDYRQRGFVAKIDTVTLREVARVSVGYQPDGIGITGGKIYVANSGGYMTPRYERTMSVIDLESFTEEGSIDVALNLNLIVTDRQGRVWVSSRGDYYDDAARLFCYDPEQGSLSEYAVGVNAMWLHGDELYTMSTAFSYVDLANVTTFIRINTVSGEITDENFLPDAPRMQKPYGLAVHPLTGEIYVTDAKTYVNPGELYCFTAEGELQWHVRTGDIPSRIAFVAE